MSASPLPIDSLIPQIVAELRIGNALVLEAPPGAGKTTRVPRALLDPSVCGGKKIVVLQPRRLATRLAAARVADELGERVGETVGYQIRFDDVSGPKTRLLFVTEGILSRRLRTSPDLPEVGVVVLDEFHERHLASDVTLAVLRQLQRDRRPDLRIVVMSATLEAEPVAKFLDPAARLRSVGRQYPVDVDHLPSSDERPLHELVLAGLKRLVADQLDGDVLVFLPGAGEIRRAREACEELAGRHRLELHALHGDLPPDEQDRAIRPGSRRKIILSTNVAETSVTIEGVAAVLDSGLARIASHSPWSGLPTLKVAKVSKASAIQRAGRAGRTRAGRCLRLYTKADFDGRPDHEAPEIRRLDLTETALSVRALGLRDPGAFAFFEAPTAAALQAADGLLLRLGAIDEGGGLTRIGRRLLELPMHPRLGRLLIEAEALGIGEGGALLAALLGERDIRQEARAHLRSRGATGPRESGASDVLEMLERFDAVRAERFSSAAARAHALDMGAVQAVERVRKQLTRLCRRGSPAPPNREDALLRAILAAYPDRVARRRKQNSPELLMFGGGSATLSDTSVVRDPELLVAVDAEERTGTRGGVIVRLASAIEAEWLLELPDFAESDTLEWNGEAERVERVTRIAYGNLVLDETRTVAEPSADVSRVLAQAALTAGIERFVQPDELGRWLARLEGVAAAFPELGLSVQDESALRQLLERLCEGYRSFAELRQLNVLDALTRTLTHEQQRALATLAPDRVTLGGGRTVRVEYERGKPPWIESRLQDFFGAIRGPSILGGRTALVLHLLAPNQRAVQVTTDLAGFWERHYPAIRKELMRKYPRHAWPEDPRNAKPPEPRRR